MQDLKALTNIVVTLEEFHVVCDAEASEIVDAQEPLCAFFSEIGQSYQNTTVLFICCLLVFKYNLN